VHEEKSFQSLFDNDNTHKGMGLGFFFTNMPSLTLFTMIVGEPPLFPTHNTNKGEVPNFERPDGMLLPLKFVG